MTAQTGRPSLPTPTIPFCPAHKKSEALFFWASSADTYIPSHSTALPPICFFLLAQCCCCPCPPQLPKNNLQAILVKYVLPVLPAHLPPVLTRSLFLLGCGWTCSQVQCATEMTSSCCASLRYSSAHWHTPAYLQPTNRSRGLAQHCTWMRYYFRSNRKRATRQKHAPTSECVPHHPTLTLPQEL